MREYPDKVDLSNLVAVARTIAKNADFLESLKELLSAAQEEVLRLELPCRACGNCCDFSAMDHRLFVSAGELALLASVRPPHRPAKLHCPYQHETLCVARDRRPLGCRLFYCNSSAQEQLHDLYETWHQRIVTLHQEAGFDYAYAEMTAWLEGYWVEFGGERANRGLVWLQVFF